MNNMGNVRVILTIYQCANKDICKVIGGHAASQPSCVCTLSQCYSNCMIALVSLIPSLTYGDLISSQLDFLHQSA